MRGYIKGGIWKNTEDEILKAAVMKYGKNQWARIASLLNRKSAKQCKTRWYEWLDPSIKKTEWSREEEEKLLHLAKIMPCQWRTIAPIVGRTAAQCLEHYEKLLDAATNKGETPADDARRLRPGEIDPNPESKPARPDQIDMEEDEKEMLQEARARLGNTKGKKAKRKARERQLEEARRLATLQKRRELKAAGLSMPKKEKKRKGIDYNKEVPYLHVPAPGFYSTAEESEKEKQLRLDPNFNPILLQKLEGERINEKEERERKKDINKMKEKMEKNLPAAVMQINKATSIDAARRKSKLVLPDAQLTEEEIRQIAEMGYDPDNQDENEDDFGSDATKALLSKYVPTPTPYHGGGGSDQTPGSFTPSIRGADRTPARPNTIYTEAQNLRALTEASTPLAGGERIELHPSDFSGATPRRQVSETPNALVTPLRAQGANGGMTPSRAGGETPRRMMRDQLNINEGNADFGDDDEDGGKQASNTTNNTKQLLAGLSALPKPKEFKIALPDDMETDDPASTAKSKGGKKLSPADLLDDKEKREKMGTSASLVDAEDMEHEAKRKAAAKHEAKLKLRSNVLKRVLPRPEKVNVAFAKPMSEIESMIGKESDVEVASELIKAEIVNMITNDAINFPTKTIRPPKEVEIGKFMFDIFNEDEMNKAKKLISEEVEELTKQLGDYSFDEYNETWSKGYNDLIFVPHVKKYNLKSLTKIENDLIRATQHQFETIQKDIVKANKKVKTLEKQNITYLTGYEKVATSKEKAIVELYQKIAEARVEQECFRSLRENELKAIPARIEFMKQEVDRVKSQETELQRRFANLVAKKNELIEKQKTTAPPPPASTSDSDMVVA
eukprot:TRINITY_DN3766_c0_g1_i1.p1 TRINITY_DN3766_c0_g1~~TRINITY_DN3766_c0_g1_i1.p1  ORF type:complete len:845 (-),score=300.09 TRINITY_DN3766_c0_g1_i1:100-2634(-)